MISRDNFIEIDLEIKKTIDDTLFRLKEVNQNEYALFLADGEYSKSLKNNTLKLNPNVIDYKMDWYKDTPRLNFLSHYLSSFYTFKDNQNTTIYTEQRLHTELMVYTHIWESKPFLKRLFRLAHLINGEQYFWEVQIPDFSKHSFIRNDIRKVFESQGCLISQIIKKGYHSQLRNAFAHSDYYFDLLNGDEKIILDNYCGDDSWEIKEISYDDWSKRFVYSSLLSYYLMDIARNHRRNLISVTGTNQFQIKIPTNNGNNFVRIVYDEIGDRFCFE